MRTLQQLTDTELINSLLKGQEQAFDVLFIRSKTDVRKVIVHYVKDRALAEDLCQDVFLKIYTSLKCGKYDEQGKFKPWALRIAHNLCMDYLRKAGQMQIVFKATFDDNYGPSTSHHAEHKMVAKQQEKYLNTLIERLPEEQKKVVRYRYFEELSFKEISALMNTSVNTSLGRMRYALGALNKQIQKIPAVSWR